jgi:excisionase family DNA binding protein
MRDKKILKSYEETQENMVSSSVLSNEANKSFFNISEACQLMGISRTTLWRLIKNEHIKVTKIGSRIIITKENINALFK